MWRGTMFCMITKFDYRYATVLMLSLAIHSELNVHYRIRSLAGVAASERETWKNNKALHFYKKQSYRPFHMHFSQNKKMRE